LNTTLKNPQLSILYAEHARLTNEPGEVSTLAMKNGCGLCVRVDTVPLQITGID
jgi:hypothetical protein